VCQEVKSCLCGSTQFSNIVLTAAEGTLRKAPGSPTDADTAQLLFTVTAAPSAAGGRRVRGFQPCKRSFHPDHFSSISITCTQATFK